MVFDVASLPPWDLSVVDAEMVAPLPPGGPSERIVLLTTGAMNPVHRGHVAMLHSTARDIQAAGRGRVVGAFLSPSHDLYLTQKFGPGKFIPAAKRIACAAAALRRDPLVRVGAWECQQQGQWPDFPVVCQALEAALERRYPALPVRVFYVCGEDHYQKCGLRKGVTPTVGVCVVARDGKAANCSGAPEDSVITSFRWIDNDNLLVVSKRQRYPLDMHGMPYHYNGYTDKARNVWIGRLSVACGFTPYYQEVVSDPTFLFHSVGFCLDEISPKANRVAFSDGANLCVYDVIEGKLTVHIQIPQKPAPKLDSKASGMKDSVTGKITEEKTPRPVQLEGVWWPTNDKLVLGAGLLGGPIKSFYVYDFTDRTLKDKTETLLPLWQGSRKAMNYQDPDWYQSVLK